jgi:TonB family protein
MIVGRADAGAARPRSITRSVPLVIRPILLAAAALLCASAAHAQSADTVPPQDSVVALATVARRPQLANTRAVVQALSEFYPDALRGTGIGGTATVAMLLDSAGVPREVSVVGPSGEPLLDAAAIRVAGVMRFRPAEVRLSSGERRRVAVRMQVPLTFNAAAAGNR